MKSPDHEDSKNTHLEILAGKFFCKILQNFQKIQEIFEKFYQVINFYIWAGKWQLFSKKNFEKFLTIICKACFFNPWSGSSVKSFFEAKLLNKIPGISKIRETVAFQDFDFDPTMISSYKIGKF